MALIAGLVVVAGSVVIGAFRWAAVRRASGRVPSVTPPGAGSGAVALGPCPPAQRSPEDGPRRVVNLRNMHVSPTFTGRGELLDEVARQFAAAGGAAPDPTGGSGPAHDPVHSGPAHDPAPDPTGGSGVRSGVVALIGPPGTGKTQLALRYAQLHRSEYDVVWLVNAGDVATARIQYAELAAPLGLPAAGGGVPAGSQGVDAKEPDIETAVDAVRGALAVRNRWLLVLDDAQNTQAVLDLLPERHRGHVLVTSRWARSWREATTAVEVPGYSVADAVGYLTHWLRVGEADATAVVEAVGCTPLALGFAVATLSRNRSVDQFLTGLRRDAPDLLQTGPPGYHSSVAAVWQVGRRQVEAQSPAAVPILRLCAFLAPVPVPLHLFAAAARSLPEPVRGAVADPHAWSRAIRVLGDAALAEVALGTPDAPPQLVVHSLMQRVVRASLEGEAARDDLVAWAGWVVGLLEAAFPAEPEDRGTWPVCAALLPHALAATGHAERLDAAAGDVASLLCRVGRYLVSCGMPVDAVRVLRKAYGFVRRTCGRSHAATRDIGAALAAAELAAGRAGRGGRDAGGASVVRPVTTVGGL